ncbi:MAG: hypothetical protein WCG47_20770, partial [Dermatophilaceae bacterium]
MSTADTAPRIVNQRPASRRPSVLGDPAAGKAACDEALQLLGPIGDQWALNHLEGMLGGLAQAEHRYEDAVAHLRRAAEATRRLGFAAAQAHHLANLGRAQEQ